MGAKDGLGPAGDPSEKQLAFWGGGALGGGGGGGGYSVAEDLGMALLSALKLV